MADTKTNIQTFITFFDRFKNRVNKLFNMDDREAQKIKRWLDEDGDRLYKGPTTDTPVKSVTTVLDRQDNPGKDNGLKYWKKANNGVGDNPDWNHLLHYKTNRGTLAHYAAFHRFDHKFNHGDSMWTEDERESQTEIDQHNTDDDYMYSVLADKGWIDDREGYRILKNNEDISLQNVLTEDLNYVQEEFDKICRSQGIKASTVEEVEAMFALPPNPEAGHNGYGGQADLLYTDPETGEHVVADLKTSKRVYDKHKYQIAAYKKAAEEHPDLNGDRIDRGEIIRINPDKQESEVYTVTDFDEYWEEFAELTHEE